MKSSYTPMDMCHSHHTPHIPYVWYWRRKPASRYYTPLRWKNSVFLFAVILANGVHGSLFSCWHCKWTRWTLELFFWYSMWRRANYTSGYFTISSDWAESAFRESEKMGDAKTKCDTRRRSTEVIERERTWAHPVTPTGALRYTVTYNRTIHQWLFDYKFGNAASVAASAG